MSRFATCFAFGIGLFAASLAPIWARQATRQSGPDAAVVTKPSHLRFARLLNRSGRRAWLTDGHRPLSAQVKPDHVSRYVPVPFNAALSVSASGGVSMPNKDGLHVTVLLEKDGKTVRLLNNPNLADVPGAGSNPGPIAAGLTVGR